jgi:G3E family GTPase
MSAKYIMIGGFLGAGKTTTVARLAQHLTEQNLRVGLITNDQGRELVDTQMLRNRGFATEEIPGGCFCCRFNSLVDAATKLTETTRPDIFIAEPVGSCTDLVATVTYPLRRIYGERFHIAPLSVLCDPTRLRRILGLDPGSSFSPKVTYIFLKQLEEADILVINKSDTLNPETLDATRRALEERFPDKPVHTLSARTGEGTQAWIEQILSEEQSAAAVMEIDYDTYAEGEALLGWLNATLHLQSSADFQPDDFLKTLAEGTRDRISSLGAEIAHLKMTLSPDHALSGDLAIINLVRNDFVPELSQTIGTGIRSGQVIVNCRAELSPEEIAACVRETLTALAQTPDFSPVSTAIAHLEHFRPGRPTPTHRDT